MHHALKCLNEKCGAELKEPYHYCSSCGNRIPEYQQRYIAYMFERRSHLVAAHDKSMATGLLTALILFLILIGLSFLLRILGAPTMQLSYWESFFFLLVVMGTIFSIAALNGQRVLRKHQRRIDKTWPDCTLDEYTSR